MFLIIEKKNEGQIRVEVEEAREISRPQKSKEFMCAIITMAAVFFLMYGGTYQIVVASIIYILVLYIIDSNLIYAGACLYYLSVYSYIGLYRCYVFSGGQRSINNMVIAVTALVLSLIPLLFSDKKKAIVKLGMIENIFLPLSLLMFLSNRYKQGEEFIIIDVPAAEKGLAAALIIAFLLEALIVLKRKWSIASEIDDIITLGSCVAIIAFNRFDGAGAIMLEDMHHPFENIIGFSQVFELGQPPFQNYVPVSGMYSIIQGAVFHFFGNGGKFANYSVTNNLFYLFAIIVIVFLLKKMMDGGYVLLFSLLSFVPSYNRVVFILPIMLLLSYPKLIEKKSAWLMTWFLTSLFHGLYYPLFGVATCIAFLPLGAWQMVAYAKSGKWKEDIKTARFWLDSVYLS